MLSSHFINSQVFPGGLGVYVFFVISGFLISRLLFSEQKSAHGISLLRFYARRIVRLYPVVLVYTVIVVSVWMAQGKKFDPLEPASALFYFANYLYGDYHPEGAPFRIFWSLSVEEHFYILLPSLIFLVRKPARILKCMMLVCISCLAIRLIVAIRHPELLQLHHFYYRTECRLDSLAYGVILACLCELGWGRRLLLRLATWAPFCASLAALLLTLILRDPFFRETLRYTVQGLAIATALPFILFRRTYISSILNWKPVVVIGVLSYSLYVWHYITFPLVGSYLNVDSRFVHVIALFGVSCILAALSYFGLERPLVRLRAKLQVSLPGGGRLAEGAAVLP